MMLKMFVLISVMLLLSSTISTDSPDMRFAPYQAALDEVNAKYGTDIRYVGDAAEILNTQKGANLSVPDATERDAYRARVFEMTVEAFAAEMEALAKASIELMEASASSPDGGIDLSDPKNARFLAPETRAKTVFRFPGSQTARLESNLEMTLYSKRSVDSESADSVYTEVTRLTLSSTDAARSFEITSSEWTLLDEGARCHAVVKGYFRDSDGISDGVLYTYAHVFEAEE